ncbi:MAG: glutamate--tRNA ligase [Candidatus Polarisedimenticolia bacterium]
MRVRFAPSPTGHLHVGNARTALFNWLLARHEKGTFILRIEDTDAERSSASSEEAILEDLRWLGLHWDEGPDKGGGAGPYRQSERTGLYAGAAARLLEHGDAYRCFCTLESLEAERAAQRQAGLPPRYAGTCRGLEPAESLRRAALEPFALRFRVEASSVVFEDLIRGRVEFPGSQIGDLVIVRADGTPTYNFAVVVDDAAMGITHVVRGEDHLSNTPRQVLLYRALGAALPEFAHLSLVLGPDGSPLSKRHGDTSVVDFRRRGVLPEAMVNYLALLGWSHPEGREALTMDEMVESFTLRRVGRAAAMFDARKLAWLNAHHLRARTPERLLEACGDSLREAGYVPPQPLPDRVAAWAGRTLQVFSGQMESPLEAAAATRPVFRFDQHVSSSAQAREALASLAGEPLAREVIGRFAELAASSPEGLLLDKDVFRQVAAEAGRGAGVKGRALFHPIRVAILAANDGPELDRVIPLIDEGSRLDLPERIVPSAERARRIAGLLAAAG